MTKLRIEKIGLLGIVVIWAGRWAQHFLTNKNLWLEGVSLVGYWKKGDSFIIKHPTKMVFWCVSRSFIKELANYDKEN